MPIGRMAWYSWKYTTEWLDWYGTNAYTQCNRLNKHRTTGNKEHVSDGNCGTQITQPLLTKRDLKKNPPIYTDALNPRHPRNDKGGIYLRNLHQDKFCKIFTET